MSRFRQRFQQVSDNAAKSDQDSVNNEVASNVEIFKPTNSNDSIPNDVWDMIQANGRLATQRLNELLKDNRFHRLKASDKAKLISLAQDRAYGKSNAGLKTVNKTVIDLTSNDATNQSLNAIKKRMTLPEYKSQNTPTTRDPLANPSNPKPSEDA